MTISTISMDVTPPVSERILSKPPNIIRRYKFTYAGREVEELIFQEWSPVFSGWDKLLWCFAPFESVMVDGKPNPVAHRDYPARTYDCKERVPPCIRESVCKLFDEHHKLNMGPRYQRDICRALEAGTDPALGDPFFHGETPEVKKATLDKFHGVDL